MSTVARAHGVALGDVLAEVDTRAGTTWENLTVLSLTKDRGLIPQTERFKHRVATEDVSKYKVVKPGQLVYNPYVLWEGAIHTLNREEPGLVSPVYPVWEAHSVDPWYLDFLLRSPQLIAAYERMASGTVKRRRSISRRDFLSIEVELPSLTEQRRIARIVSTMQQSLATAKSVSSMKEKLHAATASSLFEPYFEGVWPVHPLGEITLKRQYGMSLKGNTAGRLPILRMTNLSDGVVTFEKLQYVDPSDDEIERYLLHPGDLLFNRTNSPELVGKIGILEQDVPSVFASYLIRLVCDTDRILPEFLNVFLNLPTVQLILRGMATRGVSQANISASTLATLNVPTPSLDSQKRIAYALSAIRLSRSASDAETKALATIYSTSQATLFAEVSS